MGQKRTRFSFISPLGKHNVRSFGADIGLHDVLKSAKTTDHLKTFESSYHTYKKIAPLLLDGINLLGKIRTSLIKNGNGSLSNKGKLLIPSVSRSSCDSLGKNDSSYYKTFTQVGIPMSNRMKKVYNGPFTEVMTVSLANSNQDYQEHKKRKYLNFRAGFNQKGFAFLAEDHITRVMDFMKFYKVHRRFEKDIQMNLDGVKQIHGCVLKTHNQLKLKNKMEYYSIHFKIHLIKITSINEDVRSLVSELLTEDNNPDKIQITNERGKLPFRKQYKIEDNKVNSMSVNFLTSLDCDLTLSSRFNERAEIVKSWTRTLTPGSLWEFNLDHHLGEGIDINYLYDINLINQEHPTGYVLAFEYVGDRRASILKRETKDSFNGYSPCHVTVEFNHEITYLTNQDKTDDWLVLKNIKRDKNFDEAQNELAMLFYPEREITFHVNFEDIIYNNKETNGKENYQLEYDQALAGPENIFNALNRLKKEFTDSGLNPEDVNEDDLNLNLKKDPADDSSTDFWKDILEDLSEPQDDDKPK